MSGNVIIYTVAHHRSRSFSSIFCEVCETSPSVSLWEHMLIFLGFARFYIHIFHWPVTWVQFVLLFSVKSLCLTFQETSWFPSCTEACKLICAEFFFFFTNSVSHIFFSSSPTFKDSFYLFLLLSFFAITSRWLFIVLLLSKKRAVRNFSPINAEPLLCFNVHVCTSHTLLFATGPWRQGKGNNVRQIV